MNIDIVSDKDLAALRALIGGQDRGEYALPDTVLQAINGVVSSDSERLRLAALDRPTNAAAQDQTAAAIYAQVAADAGLGIIAEDPLAPHREMVALHARLAPEISLHDRSWRHWSQQLVERVRGQAESIADTLGASLDDALKAARPIADALAGFRFADPTALHRASRSAVAAFTSAEPLVVRHDAIRYAAWGLQEIVRPRGGNDGSDLRRDQWVALAYRFAGGGIELSETEQWFSDAQGQPTIRQAKLAGVSWSPTGHPVERLTRAVAAAADADPVLVSDGRVQSRRTVDSAR